MVEVRVSVVLPLVCEGGREVCLGGGNIEEERGYLGSPGTVTSRVCIGGA